MAAVLEAPITFVESLADLRFPAKTDEHLQRLMDRNTEGQLSVPEREELEALVELSERMALLRAQALRLLGRSPRWSLSWAETVRVVRARAQDRCEYCLMRQALQGGTFHIEHIIPNCQNGSDSADNLALSCPGCNLVKGARIAARDPETGAVLPLFNPRTDSWPDHLG